ncbi:hypothetical protein WJX74_003612 [Apatococcus lobatus]|uniref:Dioxygenase n=1 Tax=Apatococcus lobatus TaxID=904363 RepID=A0AAW1QX39_9CHLO
MVQASAGPGTGQPIVAAATLTATPTIPEAEEMFDLSAWNQRDWAGNHQNAKEHPDGYWVNVEGELPKELCGTYFRNGPGTYSLGGQELAHPFDGHGYIVSIAIKDGKAFTRGRFVHTPEYRNEVGQQKILFRGSFGTQKPGGARKNAFDIFMKNAANTSIHLWGGRLLALFEAGQPYAMDPYTLETLGTDLLGGAVRPGAAFDFGSVTNSLTETAFKTLGIGPRKWGGEHKLGGDAVTAHPRYDPDTGRMVFYRFQVKLSLDIFRDGAALISGKKLPLTTVITFFELDQGMKEVCRLEYALPGYTFLHDFALTPTHYVLIQNPVAMDPAPFMLGKCSAASSIKFVDGQPAEVHLVRRPVDGSGTQSAKGTQLKLDHPAVKQLKEEGLGPLVTRGADTAFGMQEGGTLENTSSRRSGDLQAACVPGTSGLPGLLVSQVPSGFVFHQANSWIDTNTNCMVILCVRYENFPDFDLQAAGPDRSYTEVDMFKQPVAQLWRYDVNLTTGAQKQQCLSRRGFEFPSVNPAFAGRRARYIYGGASLHPTQNLPVQSVARFDLDTGLFKFWTRGSRYFMGEPQFIPKDRSNDPGINPLRPSSPTGANSGTSHVNGAFNGQSSHADPALSRLPDIKEDDGWIISIGYDASSGRSEAVVLDAADIEAGPIATLPLASPVGYGIHGSWSPSYFGP